MSTEGAMYELTERAMYEREWGHFPELAKVLSDKQLKLRWTGPSSVSDNMFLHIGRLLRIFALVEDYPSSVDEALAASEQSTRRELVELSEGLAWAAERFAEASRQVRGRADRA